MALGDSFLEAAIRQYQPPNSLARTLGDAQTIQQNDNTLARQQLQLAAEREETPLKTALFKEQTKSQLLANAIATSPDADTWDAHMREVGKQFPEALQYVGRYSPVLQSRLAGVYGGQSDAAEAAGAGAGSAGGGKAGAVTPPTAAFDNQFAQTTPEARADYLNKLSTLSSALESVGDETAWETMRQKMHAAGIPIMDQLGGYSPIKATSLYNKIQPILNYLQGRVAMDSAGIPVPKAAPVFEKLGNSLFAVDPYTGTAREIASAGKYASGGTDLMGNPIIFNQNTGERTGGGGGAFGFDTFADRMTQAENTTGDRTAKNPLSSATGNGQFTDKTWLDTIKAARPELAENMTDKQLLQLRKDPAIAKEMTAEYARGNANLLEQNGEHVNATSLALMHRFGPQGGLAVLKASPDTKLSAILSADAIKANPGLEKQTAGEYVQDLSKRVGTDAIGQPQGTIQPITGNTIEERLNSAPKQFRATLKAMLEGRAEALKGFSLRSPMGQNLMRLANDVDPSFDATTFSQRMGAHKDLLGGGAGYKALQAASTSISHLGRLADQVPTVSGAALPFVGSYLNAGINAAESPFTGGPTAYRDTLGHLAEETTRLYRGTGGNEADIERTLKNLSENRSTTEKMAGIENTVHLIYGRVQSQTDAYNKAMGTDFPPGHFLSPSARKVIAKLGYDPDSGEKIAAPAEGGGTAPAPVPARPSGVPAGSMYSPSRQMWRDPSGRLYDAKGRAK